MSSESWRRRPGIALGFHPSIRKLGRELTADYYAWVGAAVERGDVYVTLEAGQVLGVAVTERRDEDRLSKEGSLPVQRLLSLLASEGETCACELVEPIGRSQPTVSHHLKVLREAGLVEGERRGTWVWYRVVPERLAELRDLLSVSPSVARAR